MIGYEATLTASMVGVKVFKLNAGYSIKNLKVKFRHFFKKKLKQNEHTYKLFFIIFKKTFVLGFAQLLKSNLLSQHRSVIIIIKSVK